MTGRFAQDGNSPQPTTHYTPPTQFGDLFVGWTLSWPYNGVFCLDRRLVCYFIYVYFPDIFRHRFDFFRNSGPKKAILRTGAHVCARGNTKNRVFWSIRPSFCVFGAVFSIMPLYTPITEHRKGGRGGMAHKKSPTSNENRRALSVFCVEVWLSN